MTTATARRANGPRVRPAVALILTVLLVSLVPVVSAAPDWPGFQKDAMHTGLQSGKDLPDELSIVWQTHLDGAVRSSPVVANGMVFIATENGNVYAFDVRNGKTLWGPVKLGEPVVGTPAFENDRLYVASSSPDGATGKIYVMSAATGASIMNITLAKGSYGGPVIHDGKLFVGHDGGNLVSYDTETMTKLWDFKTFIKVDKNMGSDEEYGIQNCCLRTDVKEKPIKAVPLVFKDRVYFGSFNHQFFAVDAGGNPGAETTDLHWVENLHDIIYSSAGVGRPANLRYDLVVVGSYDGRVSAFDTEPLGAPASCPMYGARSLHAMGHDCSKRVQWTYDTGSRVFASPAIANDRAYVGDEGGVFHSINLQNGKAMWTHETGNTIRSSAAVLNNTIVVGGFDGKLYMYKEDASRNLLPGYPKVVALSDKIHASPALAEDKVFVATQDGIMYALAAPGTAVPPGGAGNVPVGDPDFQLKDLMLTPRKAVAGQPLEVTVDLHNLGGHAKGTVNLRLYDGDALLDQTDLEVAGGSKATHSFIITPAAGDLFLRLVVDENGTFSEAKEDDNILEQHHVVEAGAPPAEDPPAEEVDPVDEGGGEDEEDVPAPPLMVIVLTLALVGMVLRRRQ